MQISHSLLILFPRTLFLHALLLRLPRLMVKWSSGQGEQAELPNWSAKVPLPHSRHIGDLSLNIPGGHATHAESRNSQPAGHVPTRDFSTGLQSGINLVIFQSTLRNRNNIYRLDNDNSQETCALSRCKLEVWMRTSDRTRVAGHTRGCT